jgi:hypothetical protein
VGLRTGGTVLAAGLEVELAKWNLGGTVVMYLTISSATGGKVTRPGEGTFPYYPFRVANLVAEAERGYRFVSWTGAGHIANVNAAQTSIIMDGYYSITANFEEKPPVNWALIGGIVGAVIIVGLVIFFVRRKKDVHKRGRGRKKTTRTKRR